MFYVYILRTINNQLYIGQTNSLDRRKIEHRDSRCGAKFIKDNSCNFQIVYYEVFNSRKEAVEREKQLKGWRRIKKEALIAGDLKLLQKL
ncbi:MAG: GIY-YIG nuclease superfamily protein [candidate division WS2 bacterium ADurb.Bin280]|uniref:GIY-YIG nuclease superfamily protein n=1 Tax=candidate division WS2 bacterium ADurb.Bin280 TaxID=1852829 RepID=A0A1V5SCJ2_9BACT|nr:MAG: GIY-YIG nuclease superfamily protein [candidate division WS2 bacterium ADurb.Bin280]